jgi:ADP-heptose:LPS heptosyltransferase
VAVSLSQAPMLLALRVLGLGDLLAAVPALRALAAAFPGHHRVLLTSPGLDEIACWTGAVDEVALAQPLAPLPERLHGAAVAVNLHGSGPESHRVLQAARPARLLAFAHPDVPQSAGGPAWQAEAHERARWCDLLTHHGIPADPADLDLRVQPGPVPADPAGATLIHPGSARMAVRWPAVRFAEVAAAEVAAGRRVLLTGSRAERPLALRVARLAGLPRDAVVAGRTDLAGLARLLAGAARLVSGDTGAAHLAVAVGTPTVTVFGPVPPSVWGPPADRPIHRVVWSGVPGDPGGAVPDPALARVPADAVLAELSELDKLGPTVRPSSVLL